MTHPDVPRADAGPSPWPRGLAWANALLGLLLIGVGFVEWGRGAPVDAGSLLRLAVFVGITGMGLAQIALGRGAGGARRLLLAAAWWTLLMAAAYLVAVLAT